MKYSTQSIIAALTLGALPASAVVTVGDSNIFNSSLTVAVSGTFDNAAFDASHLVDGTNNAFVFDNSNISQASISGFNSGIETLRFFDTPSYTDRLVLSVDVYFSSSLTSSLLIGDYTYEGSYIVGPSTDGDLYVNKTDPAEHPLASDPATVPANVIGYADVTGLSIPDGTQSILLVTTAPRDIGAGLSEIQGFAAVPEPSSAALLGLAGLVLGLRRRK